MKAIKTKHIKDGIMRRNKLLLEHILHERLEKSISTIYYYHGLELESPKVVTTRNEAMKYELGEN